MTQSSEAIVPLGAMRFNSDIQRLEYWNGSAWFQIHTFSPNLDGGARGIIFFAFDNSNNPKMVDFITIPTAGNATDFGDMTGDAKFYGGGFSSNTRAVYFGGSTPGGSYKTDQMQFITISSTGDSQDFGDLTAEVQYNPSGVSNQTRGIRCGGATVPTTSINILDYVTIASEGNAIDFGDMVRERRFATSANTPIRGFVTGGDDANTKFSDTELITIPTTGNSFTFGDLGNAQNNSNNGVICSATRAIMGGGSTPLGHQKTIKKLEMTSLGSHTDFGDLSAIRIYMAGCSNPVRGVFCGGNSQPSPAYVNTMEYINISTGGDAVDFGDRTEQGSYNTGVSNAHGGLG
tara:strand:- start:15 stop:1055 length:1041 start_codon:yes stop_codon:yes gene_type:complete